MIIKKRSIKLSSFMGLVLAIFSVVVCSVILISSRVNSEKVIEQENLKLFKNNHESVTMIFKNEREKLVWVAHELKPLIDRVVTEHSDNNYAGLKDSLAAIFISEIFNNYDVMLFISFDGEHAVDASSPFFNTDDIVKFLKNHKNLKSNGFIYSIEGSEGKSFDVLLGNFKVENPKSGEVLGYLYLGKIINNSPDFIFEAYNGIRLPLAFVSGGSVIASSPEFGMEKYRPEACLDEGTIIRLNKDFSAYCKKIKMSGEDTPLMVYQAAGNQSILLLSKQTWIWSLGLIAFIAVMTFLVVYGFRRVMTRSLEYLTDYAHRISTTENKEQFKPTPVYEFNKLGDVVFAMNRELREAQAYLNNFLSFARVPLIAWDKENKIILFNKAMEELSGVEQSDALGQNLEIIFNSLVGEKLKELLSKASVNADSLSNFESMIKNIKTGDMKYVLWSLSVAGEDENNFGVVLQGIDITDRKSSEEKLLLASKVFESTIEAIYITNMEGIILSVNNAFLQITGFSEDEAIGNKTSILRSGRHTALFYKNLWSVLKNEGAWQGEIWNRRKNGELYPALLNISSIKDTSGQISHYIGVMHDITERKKYEEQIKYQSHYDPLTNLPNRYLFLDRLAMAISRAKKNQSHVGLISIDIDRFKNVNDTLGHNIGDILLQKIAERIVSTVGDGTTVSRLGGDEYTIIIDDLTDKNRAVTIAYNVMKQIEKPFKIDEYELFLKCSAGLSFYPEDGTDVFTVTKNADAAMYRAKSKGRGMLQIYTTDFNDFAKDRLILETKLNRALDNGEFELYYQPKILLSTMELVGMEALIRWNNPELGRVYPDMFIPIAEETGLIVPIGQWVLKQSCEDLIRWRAMGYDLKVAVNLSFKQFIQKDLYSSVKNILTETGMEPKHLELEITESTIMVDTENTRDILNRLNTLGITFAIDDFGTGFSSIGYLTKIPIDTMKIDKSFTLAIDTSENALSIVRSVIQLSKNLNINVVAEGVENETHLMLLRELECTMGQGYYFSKPVPAAEFEILLKNWNENLNLEIQTGKRND